MTHIKDLRTDLAFIAHWVREGAHVLDIGCGDGALLDYLQTDKRCTGYGIEIADEEVLASTRRGVNVLPLSTPACEAPSSLFV